MVDVSQHKLVPDHTLLDEEAAEAMLDEYDVKRTNRPKIKRTDPALPDGAEPGDVVKIVRDSRTTDEAITQRLAHAIDRDPYVDKTAVTVKVEGGLATIDGSVDSQFEKEQLNEIASNVKGVIAINNSVEVTADGQDT
jgi:DNA-directed RNA polymerase subunit H